MKLGNRIEDIFSHAVALQQSGRLRSTVYCLGNKIYILNQDHTVLLRFSLRSTDKVQGSKSKAAARFSEPVSFAANDYDSRLIEIRDGQICFVQEEAGWERTKSCRTPAMAPKQVAKMFRVYPKQPSNTVTFHSDMLTLLDESLSHVEFRCENGELSIIQRNIYSGSVLELKRKSAGGLLQASDDLEDFDSVGMRTNDFMALFTFEDIIKIHFVDENFMAMENSPQGREPDMRGLISKCRYDELGGTGD